MEIGILVSQDERHDNKKRKSDSFTRLDASVTHIILPIVIQRVRKVMFAQPKIAKKHARTHSIEKLVIACWSQFGNAKCSQDGTERITRQIRSSAFP